VLAEANRNILYVDEVNLLDDHIVDVLLDAPRWGINTVEREGVSSRTLALHPRRTMNPEEGELRPQLLDRFGLCVDVEGIRDIDQRVAIVESARYGGRPQPFRSAACGVRDRASARRSPRAINTFPEVDLPREILRLIAQISIALEGRRPPLNLVCARAAQAKAAYDSSEQVAVKNVADVAEMVFAHAFIGPIRQGRTNLGEVIAAWSASLANSRNALFPRPRLTGVRRPSNQP